ncbi:MAG: tetratricopeptide repeat-containing serine protease family protein [Thermoanaerobaculia bacterium]
MHTNRHSTRVAMLPAAFALALLTVAGSSRAENPLPELVKRVKPAIATITAHMPGDDVQIGTGFFVQKGILVTNRHVLAGALSAEVKTDDGRVFEIEHVTAEDADSDLVKVDLPVGDDASIRTLELRRNLPEPGSRVVVIGSPFGLEKTVSDGIVSTVRQLEDGTAVIQITAPISPGSSGSPVLDLDGRVIGVATIQLVGGQNLNFAIPAGNVMGLKNATPEALNHWTARELAADGMSAAGEGNWGDAQKLFEQAAEADSKLDGVYLWLGRAFTENGRDDDALDAYRRAVVAAPSSADAQLGLGRAYARMRKWSDAISSYREALRLSPKYVSAISDLGRAYLEIGDTSSALAELQDLQALDPAAAESLRKRIREVAGTPEERASQSLRPSNER